MGRFCLGRLFGVVGVTAVAIGSPKYVGSATSFARARVIAASRAAREPAIGNCMRPPV